MNEIFVKNYHDGQICLWVNGSLQGCIPPGKTAWIEAAGFVTRDSGVQPDGSLRITPAYGGWDRRDESDVVLAGHNAKGGIIFAKLSVPKDQKQARVSVGGGPAPKGIELERAIHVQQGHLNISLRDIRPPSSRDFAQSPAGRFASADGKLSLDIKPSAGGGYEAALTSFDKTYPLKVAQRGKRVRLSNSDANIDLDADWTGEELTLAQGSSKKLLKDLDAAVEVAWELDGAAFAGSTWKLSDGLVKFEAGGTLSWDYERNGSWRGRGTWKLDGNTVAFDDGYKKYSGTLKGRTITGTCTHKEYVAVPGMQHSGVTREESNPFTAERQ